MVDAGGANIGSVRYALQRLGVEPELTTDAAVICAADRVLLPGVGTAALVMQRLRDLDLVQTLRELQAPLLGVCVGMQVLFEHSEEDDTDCLGLLQGRVRRLQASEGIRVPHMGWNALQFAAPGALADEVAAAGGHAYFVHSYAAPVTDDCLAWCHHGHDFAAIVARGHVAGAQFHPERSAAVGACLLARFLQGPLA